MNIPSNLQYAESHEWIKVDGDIGTVGISDHAQHELSDVVFVELPKVGTQVEAKGAIAVVESVKAASDIYAPVSGEVIEVNQNLANDPATLNHDPYQAGWIFKIKIRNKDDLQKLKSAEAYKTQIGL